MVHSNAMTIMVCRGTAAILCVYVAFFAVAQEMQRHGVRAVSKKVQNFEVSASSV